MKLFTIILLCLQVGFLMAQDLTVPDDIKKELEVKRVDYHGKEFVYKVKYPSNHSKYKKYKVYLALSGGDQSEETVDYCYYAWFRSTYFDKYITIMPISNAEGTINDWDNDKILDFYDMLRDNENISIDDWIIGGTSNGGNAVYHFLRAYPDFFEGAIVMPGGIKNQVSIPESWKHIKFVLAYGEKDIGWDKVSTDSFHHLEGEVKDVQLYEMKGQEHVVTPDYDIDQVYSIYFGK